MTAAEQAPHPRAGPAQEASNQPVSSSVEIDKTPQFHWVDIDPLPPSPLYSNRRRALKALSTQWDADQQQHVEELDILRARIDDLAQLVTDYAAQHEQHAAALEKQAAAWQAQQQQLSTQVGILTEQYAHITEDYKKLAALLAQV